MSDLVAKKKDLSSSVDFGSSALPAWADPNTLLEGQRFLCTHGLEIAHALFFASLPYSYTASKGSHVLARTGRIDDRRHGPTAGRDRRVAPRLDHRGPPRGARRRNAGIPIGPRGIRLFHAAVRLLIDRAGNWDDTLGMPINQEDLLGTLIVFTIVALDTIADLGVDLTSQKGTKQRDAYVHFWLVVGHLLGIDYDSTLRSATHAYRGATHLRRTQYDQHVDTRRQAAASIDGQILMASLLEKISNELPWFLRAYPAAATHGLIGMERADMLGVPPAGPGRVPFEIVKIGSRLLSPLSTYGGLATLARTSTKYLYRDWIVANNGLDPPSPENPNGPHAVLATGEPQLVSDIPDAAIVAAAVDDMHLGLLRELGLRSFMCVPLRARGRVLAAITFVTSDSGRRFTDRTCAWPRSWRCASPPSPRTHSSTRRWNAGLVLPVYSRRSPTVSCSSTRRNASCSGTTRPRRSRASRPPRCSAAPPRMCCRATPTTSRRSRSTAGRPRSRSTSAAASSGCRSRPSGSTAGRCTRSATSPRSAGSSRCAPTSSRPSRTSCARRSPRSTVRR